MRIKVPCGSFERPIFTEVIASPVTIPGFEEFQFAAHRMVSRDYRKKKEVYIQKKYGWAIACLPSGCAVPIFTCQSKKEAILQARECLEKAGIQKVRQGFDEAAKRLNLKRRRVNASFIKSAQVRP